MTAAIVPATPGALDHQLGRRSRTSAPCEAAYDDLAARLRSPRASPPGPCGRRSTTRTRSTLLTSRGHTFDGEPAAMTLDLERLRAARTSATSTGTRRRPSRSSAGINDLAYGYAAATGYARRDRPGRRTDLPIRLYRARREGETACVLGDDATTATTSGSTTSRPARARPRQGLASRLLAAALAEARSAACGRRRSRPRRRASRHVRRLGYERQLPAARSTSGAG